MNILNSKRNYIELLCKALENDNEDTSEVLIFYGQEGIGKTTLKNKMIKSFSDDIDICEFDLMLYMGYSFFSILDALYYFCNNLEAKKTTKIFEFDIADNVYCSKVFRVPRIARNKSNLFSVSSDIEGVISNLSHIPYIGSGIKTLELLRTGYKQLKNNSKEVKSIIKKYKDMDIKELEETLPKALAFDISQKNKKINIEKKRVILIDNFERIWGKEIENMSRAETEKWIYEIIKESKNVIWVIFSNEKLNWKATHNYNLNVNQYKIQTLSKDEINEYINSNRYIIPDNAKERLFEISEGIPFRLDLIIKYCQKKQEENQEINEDELKNITSRSVISHLINSISERGKELLYLACVAEQFDEELIRKLLPSYPFKLHEEKYESLFFKTNNINEEKYYNVSIFVSSIVLDIIGEEQQAYYNKTIFEYYYGALKQLLNIEFNLGVSYKIEYCFNRFRVHGRNLKDRTIYVRCLLNLNDSLIYRRLSNMILEEYSYIYKKRNEYNIDNDLLIRIIENRARLSLIIGNYAEAVKAIDDGMNIIHKEKDVYSYTNLLSYKMKVQDMYQTSTSENITQESIGTGEEYLKCLESLNKIRVDIVNIEKICEIKLFLGKQYVILGNCLVSKNHYNEVLEICNKNIQNHINSLYKYKAIALEKMGEIYAIEKNREKSKELYEEALENYDIAQYNLNNYDYDIILNNGLAWKRLAESEFSFNNIKKAIECVENAILKYNIVEKLEPDIIDIYCKKGFAYLDSAERLLKSKENATDIISKKINEYINNGIETGNKGLERQYYTFNNDDTKNRQIHNIICKGKRLLANYNEDKASKGQVIELYKDAISSGDNAIKNAPGHIYAYSGHSETCLMYCEYLRKHDDTNGDINIYCIKGLESIEKALKMSNNIQRFILIKLRLEELQG